MSTTSAPHLKFCVPHELNPPLNVTVVEDLNGLDRLTDFFSRCSVFGLDTETNIVPTFFNRRIRTIQLGDRHEQYVIDLLPFAGSGQSLRNSQGNYKPVGQLATVAEVLKPALESNRWLKVGANLQFDYEVLKWCMGLRPWNFYDVQLAEKVLYAGEVGFFESGFWALDDLVARYLGMQISKEQQKTFDLDHALTDKQIAYAALDTRLPIAIKNVQRPRLEKATLLRASQIEFDAIPAFGDMHLNGFRLDRSEWLKLVASNRILKAEVVARLDEFFVPIVGRKEQPPAQEELDRLETIWKDTKDKTVRAEARQVFMTARKKVTEFKKRNEKGSDSFEGQAAINYGSSPQLHAALLTLKRFTKNNLPDTNDQSLKKLKDDPIIACIREYRKVDKLLDTYGETWADQYIDPDTKRVHSNIHQLGAETGRTSSSVPNIQNLPRDKRYRHCFISEPGYKMLTCDYNGCELRILAEYSQERIWIDAFRNGWDVHSVCAELLLKDKWISVAEATCAYIAKKLKCSCEAHKKFREWLKSVNFGIAYGMTARRLAIELSITEAEATELLTAFYRTFPTLVAYLEKSGKQAVSRLESRTLAMRRRLYRKPTWEQARVSATKKLKREPNQKEIAKQYKAIFAAIEREGKNTPIQGSNADFVKLAIGCGFDENGKPYLWHLLEPVFDGLLVNMVHDETVSEVPDEKAEAAFPVITECMSRAAEEFVKSVPMPAEGHIDTKWQK
jgi:DNA polymerase-1